MSRALYALTFSIGLVVLVTALAAFQFLSAGPGSHEERTIFEVPYGMTFVQIARKLSTEGLIRSYLRFRIFAKLTGQESRVKSGEYELDRGMTPQQILSVLASGKSIQYPVTFPEGTNIYEMATTLEKRGFYKAGAFLTACRDPQFIQTLLGERVSSLEGYLFPDTYNLTKYTPLRELIAEMVRKFLAAYSDVAPMSTVRLSRHEAVILASMIEKETGAPQERPLIASIFHNRLHKGMKLQSDPTIIYGIWAETGVMKENITKNDILSPTQYNTYYVPRLPYGPIANPGRDALLAALRPSNSENFYFVSRNDGTHIFTKTYEEHLRAVRSFQLDPAARKGKSWRNLKAKASGTPGK